MAEMDNRVWRLTEDGEYYEMIPEVKAQYQKSIDAQLQDWLNGVSVHTKNLPPGIEEECCPDFSCCNPDLLWPIEKRQVFANASRAVQEEMLMGSLAAAAASIDNKIYLAGQQPNNSDIIH